MIIQYRQPTNAVLKHELRCVPYGSLRACGDHFRCHHIGGFHSGLHNHAFCGLIEFYRQKAGFKSSDLFGLGQTKSRLGSAQGVFRRATGVDLYPVDGAKLVAFLLTRHSGVGIGGVAVAAAYAREPRRQLGGQE